MKRALQITLGVVGAIPFVLGILQLTNGASMFLPTESVTANVDSQIRFGSVWFMLASFLGWWMIPNVERHGPLFRIVFLTMGAAGLARLLSIYLVGAPDPQMIGAAILEISLILLVPWQAVVARRARAVMA